jgi:hypothetical protein
VNDYKAELSRAIAHMHGAPAVWLATVPVREVFQGQTAWEGDVETFTLTGHPKASQCYAWGVRRDDDKGWDVTAVLAIPPVTSPETAVKAAIAAYAKQHSHPPSRKP